MRHSYPKPQQGFCDFNPRWPPVSDATRHKNQWNKVWWFQSTHRLWAMRSGGSAYAYYLEDFNPRTACERCDIIPALRNPSDQNFNPRTACERCDIYSWLIAQGYPISIRAPPVSDATPITHRNHIFFRFQSTHRLWAMRQKSHKGSRKVRRFQSTHRLWAMRL